MRSWRRLGMGAAVAALASGCELIAKLGDPITVEPGGNADGEPCVTGTDCKDKVCASGTCAAPTCHDGVENGEETDVDCGGPMCPPCHAGETCKVAKDCLSDVCTAMTCILSCTANVKDGDETDVDCGGDTCPGCAIGKMCKKNTDCLSGVCSSGTCVDFALWAERMGPSTGADQATLAGLGIDETGNALMAANFGGKASFGGTVYDTGASFDPGFAFGRYNSLGSHLWDSGFVGGSVDRLAVTASGEFAALGTYASTGIMLGPDVTLPNVQPNVDDAFVAQFDASNVATLGDAYAGGHLGVADSDLQGVVLDAAGGIVVAGQSSGGTYNIGVAVQPGDFFVANLGLGWGHTFSDGGAGEDFVAAETDAAGDVFIAGFHQGKIDFGCGPTDSASAGGGFVVMFDSNGSCTWTKSFAAAPDGLAVDPSGSVVVCGEFSGSLDFGLGPLTTMEPMGISIFVTKLGSTGSAVWDKAFPIGGPNPSVLTLVTLDPIGDVLLGANAHPGIVNFGGGMLSAVMLLAKLDPSGSYVWSNGFGMDGVDHLAGVAAYDAHAILLGGTFGGMLAFGSQPPLSSVGMTDVFLAKLSLP